MFVDNDEIQLSDSEKLLTKDAYDFAFKSVPSPPMFCKKSEGKVTKPADNDSSTNRWISEDIWRKQGFTATVLTLSKDIVIPTNSEKKILKNGDKIMIIQFPKGVEKKQYIQFDNGKIVAVQNATKFIKSLIK